MHLVLFDDAGRGQLIPFTHTRPAADIRTGILTTRERWERVLGFSESFSLSAAHLQALYPAPPQAGRQLLINGRVQADMELAKAVQRLQPGQSLSAGNLLIAAMLENYGGTADELAAHIPAGNGIEYSEKLRVIERPWDIFAQAEAGISADFPLLTEGRGSATVPEGVHISGSRYFIEPGAQIGAGTVINAKDGPVYIGANAEIMEGCLVRGPFALCEGATLKMGAKVYKGTTIGPGCKVGGEVSNVVFFANSNKGHDGFLGNAVVGEWCNFGADTNCSNLKNNYDEVKVWDEAAKKSVRTGLSFCGLMMGDHSKCGINTMFNTGTVAGVSCNIWGGGFPEKFIPSFSWGGPEGMSIYKFERAMETAARVMARRGKELSEAERAMLQAVFEQTGDARDLMNIS
jgi:UDP-N-acetylglucosamine diphosphorylase/glucosamine-1-phosphate N-acetyltransferase